MRIGATDTRAIHTDQPKPMGLCRRIKEIRLQAAGWSTVVMEDKWTIVVAGFKISEGSVSNSESSFACQLRFLN